jgi:hypothetical protein
MGGVLTALASSTALALGGWVSSGGELLQDSVNPWFFSNVKTAHYCFVENSAGGFSSSSAKARTLFREALDYWKREFRENKNPFPVTLGIASQNFVENVSCDGSEDLTVYLGYETLTSEQKSKLGENLRRFLGLTVRTDYQVDSPQQEYKLRGKGFIYIASDQGPNAFEGPKQAVKTPWSYEGLLLRIFAHELGHVFGISHTDAGVMGATFSENLVMPNSVYRFKNSREIQRFSTNVEHIRRCDFSSTTAKWLELPDDARCLILSTGERGLEIAYENAAQNLVPHGVIRLDKSLASSRQVLSAVFLPPNQTLFSNTFGLSYLPSSSRNVANYLGTFVGPQTGKSKSARVALSPSGIEILGVNETELEIVFQ